MVLLGVVLTLTLSKRGEEIGLLVTITVCCMVGTLAISYLEPAMELIGQLQSIGQIDNEILQILLKAVGIGLVTELASMICTDAGKASMGKALQMLGTAVILWLSLPLMTQLLELLQDILGEA